MIPQLIIIALSVFTLGVTAEQHGKPKDGKENIFATLIATAISQGLLYWGGFYDELIRRVSGG